ncbi:MAG: PAS domain S-box protein [Proteobacteria bacterium]|nr:PAS domain S-box protein [Pseudomonadota bacterium]
MDQIAYEYRVRHRDGHYFWLHDQLSSVRDAAGNPSMVVGSWFDVTERKQVEATLVEQVRLAHFGADVRSACAQKRTVKGILDHCVEAMVRHLNAALH